MLRTLPFPLLLAWPLGLALFTLSHRPIDGLLIEVALFVACVAPVVASLLLLEQHLPFQPEDRPTREDVTADLTHLAMGYLVLTPLAQLLLKALAWVTAGWLASIVPGGLWPKSWPLGFQLLLALVIGEFGQYWFHRLAHRTELGWRVHATHHGTPQLYWLNANRFHAIETILKNVLQVGPLILLGCTKEAFLVYGILTAAHGWLLHANVDFRLGAISWFLGTPANHRWHHSTVVAEADHNFGGVLTVWDHVFGTWYSPRGRSFRGEVGIGEMPDFPKTWVEQLKSPIVWERLPRRIHRAPDPSLLNLFSPSSGGPFRRIH
jgi:sterol desaturase/sphingolipid hydroxylase (fatty acid hydroxylase superfamily)